jgi:hypothetical protein
VIRLWELEADDVLAIGDVGLVPWVPLTRTTLTPDERMTRCHERLVRVPDPIDRAGLMAVTQILAGLAFPGRSFWSLFGGAEAMIESPVLDEVKEILLKRGRVAEAHELLISALETRFGRLPAELQTQLTGIADLDRLRSLMPVAVTCPNLAAFVAAL